jgi:hypothetical protein
MEGTLLGDVHPNHYFVARDGTKIKNLVDLYNSLQSMDDITFNHHVNDFKNDFHNWVRDIHKDDELASNLLASKSKKEMIEHLKGRVAELQSIRKEVKAVEAKSNIAKKKPQQRKEKKKKKEQKKEVTSNIYQHAEAPEEEAKPEVYSPPKTIHDFLLGLLIGVIAALIVARFVS